MSFFHGTYPCFQACKLFFDFCVDLSLQAFKFFCGFKSRSCNPSLVLLMSSSNFPIPRFVVVRYFRERLCNFVHIDFDFFHICTFVIDRSNSDTSSVLSFSSFVMCVIHFLVATASSSRAVCGFSSSSPLTSIFGSDSFFFSVSVHWCQGTRASKMRSARFGFQKRKVTHLET